MQIFSLLFAFDNTQVWLNFVFGTFFYLFSPLLLLFTDHLVNISQQTAFWDACNSPRPWNSFFLHSCNYTFISAKEKRKGKNSNYLEISDAWISNKLVCDVQKLDFEELDLSLRTEESTLINWLKSETLAQKKRSYNRIKFITIKCHQTPAAEALTNNNFNF